MVPSLLPFRGDDDAYNSKGDQKHLLRASVRVSKLCIRESKCVYFIHKFDFSSKEGISIRTHPETQERQ